MPDIHVPKLEGHGGGKSIFKLVLEVALIGVGVFLGLAGEQWRENARHRELARGALERFRTELTANRKAVVDVKDYHVDRLKELNAYFNAKPSDRDRGKVTLHITQGVGPEFLEHSAWDLAVATQALTYIDTDLGVSLSSLYNIQQSLMLEGQSFMQGMFVRPPGEDITPYLAAMQAYCGDVTLFESRLMPMYDDALQRIDKALSK